MSDWPVNIPFAGLPYRRQPSNLPNAEGHPLAWVCPRCKVVNAPWVAQCKCKPAGSRRPE